MSTSVSPLPDDNSSWSDRILFANRLHQSTQVKCHAWEHPIDDADDAMIEKQIDQLRAERRLVNGLLTEMRGHPGCHATGHRIAVKIDALARADRVDQIKLRLLDLQFEPDQLHGVACAVAYAKTLAKVIARNVDCENTLGGFLAS